MPGGGGYLIDGGGGGIFSYGVESHSSTGNIPHFPMCTFVKNQVKNAYITHKMCTSGTVE